MKKITVIIPVWNTEKYIEECLDSILAQSIVDDLEIICVNDGSTDGSLEILRSYEERYAQVRVLDQTNGGQSAARNHALKYAEGKYVYFMDGDDLLTSHALEELWTTCEEKQLDLLYFSGVSFYESKELEEEFCQFTNVYYRKGKYEQVLSGEDMLAVLRKNRDYMVSPCLQFIRRDLLEKNNIRFYEGIIHEDNGFSFKTLLSADRVFCVNDIYFYRRVRGNSVMTGGENWRNLRGYFATLVDQMEFLRTKEITNLQTIKEIENILWFLTRHVERIYSDLSVQEREKFINSCSAYERYLANSFIIKPMQDNQNEITKLKRQLKKIKKSRSYRIGRKITAPARLIKGGFKCCKQHGFVYTCKLAVKKVTKKLK